MYSLIMLSVVFITVLSLYYGNLKPAMKVKRNIYMGVTLPEHILKSDLINECNEEYKDLIKKQIVLMIITSIPIFLLDIISFNMIYILSWTFFFTYYSSKPYVKMNHKLMKLKKENEWYVGEKQVGIVDTKMSMLKSSMPLSKKYFLIPIAVACVSVIIGFENINKDDNTSLIIGVVNFISTLLITIILLSENKMKLKVYSEDSNINIAINSYERKAKSIFNFFIISITSIFLLMIILIMEEIISLSLVLLLGSMFVFTIAVLYGRFYINKKVSELEEELISNDKNTVYIDEDDYWIDGMYYYNENDKSSSTKPRYGDNIAYNLATKSGKFMGKTLPKIAIVGVLTPIVIMLFMFDFTNHSMDIVDDKVYINTFMYGYEFDIDDIESIELLDELPDVKMKTNGAATKQYARGNFKLSDYGRAKIYVYHENPGCIFIRLKNMNVIYNTESMKETENLYEKIKSAI